MNVAAIENKAFEMAAKAKPGSMKIGDKLYTFVFNQKQWYYEVYENGFFLMNVNTKTVAGVKRFLKDRAAN